MTDEKNYGGPVEKSIDQVLAELNGKHYEKIPVAIRQEIADYLFRRKWDVQDGLMAFICNVPVHEAMGRSRDDLIPHLKLIAQFFHWVPPTFVWGSREKFDSWISGKTLTPSNWKTDAVSRLANADKV